MSKLPRIIGTEDGFGFYLDGTFHGTWHSPAEAKGGLTVELARKECREIKDLLSVCDGASGWHPSNFKEE